MKLKNVVLALAIMILTIFVAYYGINTIYPKPQYDKFCDSLKSAELIETQGRCEEIGGMWTAQTIECIKAPCPQGWCDRDYTCRKDYEAAEKSRSRTVFFIALPLGIILVFLGSFVFGLEAVGTGIMGGGVGTLLYGGGAFWPYTENLWKFVISLIGLVLLVWLTYYFTKKFEKKK